MSAAFDVCVVGSANLDLVASTAVLPSPGETVLGRDFAEHPGGKGLNQAVAAARCGARTAFVSAVGDDNAGEVLLDVMRTDGIDTTNVSRRAGVSTGRALIGVADNGENSIIVVAGANASVTVEQLPQCSVVLAQLEVPLATIEVAFRAARHVGATTVLNPAPAQQLGRELLALCDVVVPNEHEAELLGGAEALLQLGAKAIVTTRGADGATLTTVDGSVDIAPFRVDARDTTAAGDTFCGALCARLAAGDEMTVALRFASAAAAISTTRAGAVPSIPHANEVRDLLNDAG
jgi:ribokinase